MTSLFELHTAIILNTPLSLNGSITKTQDHSYHVCLLVSLTLQNLLVTYFPCNNMNTLIYYWTLIDLVSRVAWHINCIWEMKNMKNMYEKTKAKNRHNLLLFNSTLPSSVQKGSRWKCFPFSFTAVDQVKMFWKCVHNQRARMHCIFSRLSAVQV